MLKCMRVPVNGWIDHAEETGDMALRSLITYIGLNLKRRVHVLPDRDPASAWKALQPFFAKCAQRIEGDQVSVRVYTGDDVPVAWSRTVIAALERAKGLSLRGWLAEGPYRVEFWSLEREEILNVLALIKKIGPAPQSKLMPYAIDLDIQFHLIDPRTNRLLAHQGPAEYGNFHPSKYLSEVLGSSRALIRLSESSNIYLFLSLPFDQVDSALREFVSALQALLPFKFSAKSWSRWTAARRSGKYVAARINEPS
jgi:hypothetical protein